MKRSTLIVGIVVLVALGLWLTQRGRDASPAQPAQAPATKESVTLRTPSFALMLNPLKMSDVESRQVATLIHAGLVMQTESGEARPMLASSWRREGNRWLFDLKKDVTFSNTTPVKASDVVRSLCNSMQPSAGLAWALDSIARKPAKDGKSVECTGLSAPDDFQVAIEEMRPSDSLLDALSGPAGWVLPGPDVQEAAFGVLPGIGPYKVREIVADSKVVLEARAGGVATARVKTIEFSYLPDDVAAAERFATGRLDVLDINSPRLAELLAPNIAAGTLKYPGRITVRPWERYRVAIVNFKALQKKGFSAAQQTAFVKAFSAAIDRKRIAAMSAGTAEAIELAFPPAANSSNATAVAAEFPAVKLNIITEPDSYSDSIAAALPKSVGKVSLDYKGVEKGVLMTSVFTGAFDVVSMLIEAPVKTNALWKSFFTPGNPYVALGTPIPAIAALDVSTPEGAEQAGRLVADGGNWVTILKERRVQATSPGIEGILFSPSGQTNLALVGYKR